MPAIRDLGHSMTSNLYQRDHTVEHGLSSHSTTSTPGHESDPTSLRITQRGLYTGPELANKWVYRRVVRGQETARNHQTNARTRDPHRTHQHSRCCRLAAGTEREVYPRDHVVTIGLRNTLYGELAARDSPLCALTHPRTPSATG